MCTRAPPGLASVAVVNDRGRSHRACCCAASALLLVVASLRAPMSGLILAALLSCQCVPAVSAFCISAVICSSGRIHSLDRTGSSVTSHRRRPFSCAMAARRRRADEEEEEVGNEDITLPTAWRSDDGAASFLLMTMCVCVALTAAVAGALLSSQRSREPPAASGAREGKGRKAMR